MTEIGTGFWGTLLAGALVALFTGVVALALARFFTQRWEEAAARRRAAEATVAEFYRAYGAVFAAWKAWDDDVGKDKNKPAVEMSETEHLNHLTRAADAEGAFESFLVRLALQRDLAPNDLERLQCFRSAYKQLRYKVRDRKPLPWWRTSTKQRADGFRDYNAFKRLSVGIAFMLADPEDRDSAPPSAGDALKNLEYVTTSVEWVEPAERLPLPVVQRRRRGLIPARGGRRSTSVSP
jgi:hypothetical protein